MIKKHIVVKSALCKRSFYYFVQQFWGTIIGEDPVWNWHIKFLCDEMQIMGERFIARKPKLYDLIINIPPGTTKSTICSQMFIAWVWAVDPSIRFITGSYSKDVSLEQADYTRDIISSDLYRLFFPHVRLHGEKNVKSNYKTTKKGQRFSTSVGGAVTGVHANCIIVDDPLNPKQSASEKELLSSSVWMDRTLSTRKVNKAITPTILIMQRLHENDPTGHLLAKKSEGIRHICLPAEVSDRVNPPELKKFYTDGLLDPVRLDTEVLSEAKIDLGSYGYGGQYAQAPAPDEGGVLKKAWFRYVSQDAFARIEGGERDGVVWNYAVDSAMTADETNDPSGMLAYCVVDGVVYLRHAQCVWLEQPDFEKELERWPIDHGYTSRSRIYIEPKANGISTAQNMRRRSTLNIVLDKPPTRDKVSRAMDISAFVESGRVVFIGEQTDTWIETMLDQLATFPNAAHDEYVDMLVIAISNVERSSEETINAKLGKGAL